MKHLILAVGIFFVSLNAVAQSAFDGFNFQLGLGAIQSKVKADNTNDTSLTPNPNINNTTSGSGFNGLASIGYSKSFDNLFKGFNLEGNIFYLMGNQSGGNVSNTSIGTDADSTVVTETLSGKYKLQNTWGISLQPGYYFSKELLGYLKFAYVSSNLQSSFSCAATDGLCLNSDFSSNKTINGIGFGMGGKYQITKNWYGALDFLYIDYTKSNKNITWSGEYTSNARFKPQQYMGFISIGYKF
jgi:hypothetical protein